MSPTEHMGIKKTIATIAVFVVLFAGVYFFVLHKASTPQVLDQFGNPVEAESVGSDLIALLDKLQGVTLDDSLFQKQAFIELTNYSTTLPAETPGRSNPFQSIGN